MARSSPRCVACKGLLAPGFVCVAWEVCGLAVDVCVSCCRAEGGCGDGWVSACGARAVVPSGSLAGLCWLRSALPVGGDGAVD
jgi:hypothetical protein